VTLYDTRKPEIPGEYLGPAPLHTALTNDMAALVLRGREAVPCPFCANYDAAEFWRDRFWGVYGIPAGKYPFHAQQTEIDRRALSYDIDLHLAWHMGAGRVDRGTLVAGWRNAARFYGVEFTFGYTCRTPPGFVSMAWENIRPGDRVHWALPRVARAVTAAGILCQRTSYSVTGREARVGREPCPYSGFYVDPAFASMAQDLLAGARDLASGVADLRAVLSNTRKQREAA
jgi:hypothetical protein